MATPRIVNPWLAYFCWNPIIHGISTRHGSHHVAQKFTSTTLPFKLASGKSPPCNSGKVTSGALGLPASSAAVPPFALDPFVEALCLQPANARLPAASSATATHRKIICCFIAIGSSHRKTIQKCQFTRKPGQPVHENQRAHRQQQHSAKYFHPMNVPAEALVKLQKLPNANRRQQKGNRQPRGIRDEQKNPARYGALRRRQRQDGRKNRPDARRPAKRECKSHQESAHDSRLPAHISKMHIAIEPSRQRRT